MRVCLAALMLGTVLGFAPRVTAHALTLQECFEGGDFIANAAMARDNGIDETQFVDRLVADIRLIQAFPPELRWFVADPEDAEFLHAEATRVFERPQRPETHRAQFLSRCFDRMARLG